MADTGAERDTQHIGDGHACDHDGNGLRSLAIVGKPVGHDGTDTEKSAVGQSRNEARGQHDAVIRRECRTQVADQDQGSETEQDLFQGTGAGQQCQQGRTDADTQGIGGDEVACRRNGNAETACHVGQDTHHDEFGNAQCESTGGQCGQAFFHAAVVRVFLWNRFGQSFSGSPENGAGAYCSAIWRLFAGGILKG